MGHCPKYFRFSILTPPLSKRMNEQQFTELSSNPLLFVQFNMASTISQLLWNECQFRERFLTSVLSNFKEQGSHIIGTNQGILCDTLGETGVILTCRAKLVTPRQEHPDRCCTNLPVFDGDKKLFMMPRSRILTEVCGDTQCSDSFPVMFTHDENISVCQFKDGPAICKSTEILDPSRHLQSAQLKTLTIKESQLGHSFRFDEDIRSMVTNSITELNARSSVTGVILHNSARCNNKIFCSQARSLPAKIRTEMGRTFQNWLAFILNFTDYGIAIQMTTLSWALFCILGALMDFFRRLRRGISRMVEGGNAGLCSFSMMVASELLVSLNPFNRTDNQTESTILQLTGTVENLSIGLQEEQRKNKRMLLQLGTPSK